ncbi:hypothetical protein VUR80DRAFT_4154 [Thermomyces stellatus]
MEEQAAEQEPRDVKPSGPEDETIIEKWQGVVEAIRATTAEAFAASPPFDASSPSTFQTYWRTVFRRLRQDVSANPDIPRHLTAPPVTRFTVTLFDQIHSLRCPCGHPDVDPNIVLENEDGVTKEDLMDAFIDCMYGNAFPRVYIEPDPLRPDDCDEAAAEDDVRALDGAFKDDGPALVYSVEWLSSRIREDGVHEAYSSEPNIVFYCCRPDEYVEKAEDGDGDKNRETEPIEQGSKAKLKV